MHNDSKTCIRCGKEAVPITPKCKNPTETQRAFVAEIEKKRAESGMCCECYRAANPIQTRPGAPATYTRVI